MGRKPSEPYDPNSRHGVFTFVALAVGLAVGAAIGWITLPVILFLVVAFLVIRAL